MFYDSVTSRLGIRHIISLSPLAKTRVARTLETFPDRLASELHLADVNAIRHR